LANGRAGAMPPFPCFLAPCYNLLCRTEAPPHLPLPRPRAAAGQQHRHDRPHHFTPFKPPWEMSLSLPFITNAPLPRPGAPPRRSLPIKDKKKNSLVRWGQRTNGPSGARGGPQAIGGWRYGNLLTSHNYPALLPFVYFVYLPKGARVLDRKQRGNTRHDNTGPKGA
jgi:hypothetical protein